MVNPQIPLIIKFEADRLVNIKYEEYESWIIQDQALFTWLLSTIYETVHPRVLSCKPSYQIWDQIYKHFNALMNIRKKEN